MIRELGVVCPAYFCTFYTSEMNTHSYMPFLFSINFCVTCTQNYAQAYLPIALFLSNNHPEMNCIQLQISPLTKQLMSQ